MPNFGQFFWVAAFTHAEMLNSVYIRKAFLAFEIWHDKFTQVNDHNINQFVKRHYVFFSLRNKMCKSSNFICSWTVSFEDSWKGLFTLIKFVKIWARAFDFCLKFCSLAFKWRLPTNSFKETLEIKCLLFDPVSKLNKRIRNSLWEFVELSF